jgi:glutaredoxin-like YruB-family protein
MHELRRVYVNTRGAVRAKNMVEVTIYSTPTCGYCTLAKDFLQEKGVQYKEIDVSVDQQRAQEMVEKTGQMGVPVIIINKDGQEEILVGFDQVQLSNLLGV